MPKDSKTRTITDWEIKLNGKDGELPETFDLIKETTTQVEDLRTGKGWRTDYTDMVRESVGTFSRRQLMNLGREILEVLAFNGKE